HRRLVATGLDAEDHCLFATSPGIRHREPRTSRKTRGCREPGARAGHALVSDTEGIRAELVTRPLATGPGVKDAAECPRERHGNGRARCAHRTCPGVKDTEEPPGPPVSRNPARPGLST